MRACSCRTRSAATASSSATRTAPSLRDAAPPAFARCTESCSASASQTPRTPVAMDLSQQQHRIVTLRSLGSRLNSRLGGVVQLDNELFGRGCRACAAPVGWGLGR
jgi:hypothetical protein